LGRMFLLPNDANADSNAIADTKPYATVLYT
jgi:hypothetical protein